MPSIIEIPTKEFNEFKKKFEILKGGDDSEIIKCLFSINENGRLVAEMGDTAYVGFEFSESVTFDNPAKFCVNYDLLKIIKGSGNKVKLHYDDRTNKIAVIVGEMNYRIDTVVCDVDKEIAFIRPNVPTTIHTKIKVEDLLFILSYIDYVSSEDALVKWCELSNVSGKTMLRAVANDYQNAIDFVFQCDCQQFEPFVLSMDTIKSFAKVCSKEDDVSISFDENYTYFLTSRFTGAFPRVTEPENKIYVDTYLEMWGNSILTVDLTEENITEIVNTVDTSNKMFAAVDKTVEGQSIFHFDLKAKKVRVSSASNIADIKTEINLPTLSSVKPDLETHEVILGNQKVREYLNKAKALMKSSVNLRLWDKAVLIEAATDKVYTRYVFPTFIEQAVKK